MPNMGFLVGAALPKTGLETRSLGGFIFDFSRLQLLVPVPPKHAGIICVFHNPEAVAMYD